MLSRFCLRTLLSAAFYFPFLIFISQVANSAEWSAQPSVKLGREYNDNINYLLQSHNTVHGTSINPILNAGVSSDIWQVNGNIDYMQKRYTNATGLDSDDHNFSLSSLFKTERSIWQLSGLLAKSSLVTEQQSNTNTGLVQSNLVQDTRNINPSWTWFMTELTRLRLAYRVSDVSYVNGESILLSDYRQQSTTVSLLHQLNPQDLITFDAGYSYFRVPKTGIVSRGTNIQAGLTRQFTDTLDGTIAAGVRGTSTIIPGGTPIYDYKDSAFFNCYVSLPPASQASWQDYCLAPLTGYSKTEHVDSTSVTYSINLEKKFDHASANLLLTRDVDPTSYGAESKVDSLTLNIHKPMTERLTASLGIYAYATNTIGGNVKNVDRKFYQLEPRLSWQWTPEMSINGSYRYAHLKRDSDNTAATANSVYLTLIYQWQKLAISR